MARELSLANKCQLLFGGAIVILLTAALATPWIRLRYVIDASLLDTSRQIALLWPGVLETESSVDAFLEDETAEEAALAPALLSDATPGADEPPLNDEADQKPAQSTPLTTDRVRIAAVAPEEFEPLLKREGFAASAVRAFRDDPERREHSEAVWDGGARVHRYARVVQSDAGATQAIVFVEHRSPRAASMLFLNRVYILTAGLLAGAMAVLVFYLILKNIIFSPVRALRDTVIRVTEGELAVRADIDTGDEFEDLGDAFNAMLASLGESQKRLRELNRSLDLRLTEVSQANITLHETARIKSEFLANISHELRTPLNSIIGFAELLLEIAGGDAEREGSLYPARHQKRVRYLENIVVAGRSLLDMINDLLEMAKLEAGKTELRLERCNVIDACEGLLALLRPQAERKRLNLTFEAPARADSFSRAPEAIIVETDARKLQQIVFNFLSNAVKFTPEGGDVALRVERVVGADAMERVRISVLDTGPGVPPEQRERIFEKFLQLEGGHTREHQGTGLGLAIAKQLAELLGAEIQMESEVGKGSMFSVIVPVAPPQRVRASERAGAEVSDNGEAPAVESPVEPAAAVEPSAAAPDDQRGAQS